MIVKKPMMRAYKHKQTGEKLVHIRGECKVVDGSRFLHLYHLGSLGTRYSWVRESMLIPIEIENLAKT